MILIQRFTILLALTGMLGCSGCKDEDYNVLAEIPFRIEFEIPAGINSFEDHFFEFNNLFNNYDNILDGLSIDPSRVERINPASAQMIVLLDNTPLSFIRETSILLFSDVVGRESEAFWTPEIPLNQNSTLNIPGTLIDAADFFEEQRIHFRVRLDTRSIPSSFVNIQLNMVFHALGN